MNAHAGWSPDGLCVACGAEEAAGPCNPDNLWGRLALMRKERDELRAAAKEYSQDDVNEMTTDMIAIRKEYERAAFRRGAEAMREAAAQKVAAYSVVVHDSVGHAVQLAAQSLADVAADIRNLPIPEDKR